MHLIWAYGGTALMIIVCLAAYFYGGRTERCGAFMICIAWTISPFVQSRKHLIGLDWGLFTVDTLLFVGLAWLSLCTRALWTLLVTAFALNAVIVHFLKHMFSDISKFSYITEGGIWGGYCLLFALSLGIWQSWKSKSLQSSIGKS